MTWSAGARAFRHLLTSQRALFAQDLNTLQAARVETRAQFLRNADAPAEQVPALVQDAWDAADFLRENVAQTERNDRGNFELRPQPEHLRTGTTPPSLGPCD